jgi:hypothetical protein
VVVGPAVGVLKSTRAVARASVTPLDLRESPEFVFELLVCRWAELSWPAARDGSVPVVGRQVGTADRRWDTVVVEADPAGLAARARFGADELDRDLLRVVRHAPADWAWYRDAIPDPGFPWRYVREAVDRAAARGVVERRKRGNRVQIRRVAPYPDWVRRVVAVENKPDLDRSAARRLSDQLVHDVDRALADETWLATAATGDRVEPALLRDLPVEAGVLAVSADDRGRATAEVAWHAAELDPGPADRERRLVLAERVYGRGFRDHVETTRPDCRHYRLRRRGDALVPYCAAKERPQTPRECAGSCESFEPEPPGWRTAGWPIAGGPGAAYRRLLARRRARTRGREESGEG